jgi:hypothetical protein
VAEKEDGNIRQGGDDLDVARVVDLHLFREQDRRQSVGRDVADHQRMAVGLGARHLLDCDDPRGAGLVFDEHAAAEALSQLLGIEAGDDVGQTARRIGNEDPERLRWIGGLRRCAGCDNGETERVHQRLAEAPHLPPSHWRPPDRALSSC